MEETLEPCRNPELALRVTLLPRDTNPTGSIFGGVILSYVDLAGVVPAKRLEPALRFVTVAMDRIQFHAPVFVGDVVSFYTCVRRIGRTSVTVQVDVVVERRDRPGVEERVTDALVTYVAIGEDGRPVPIRQGDEELRKAPPPPRPEPRERPLVGERRDPALRVTLLPRDTNAAGAIFGGVILSHLDLAAAIPAARTNPARRYVTVAMDRIQFHAPVFVGDLVSFYTQVLRIGRTSITVGVDVFVERRDRPGVEECVTEAVVTYVAIGRDGRPVPIRDVEPPAVEA